MVLLVSALYAGCWLPQNLLMNIWVSYDPSITSHPYILYIWYVFVLNMQLNNWLRWGCHVLAMFHSIINPIIYYNQNKRIHEAINYLLRFLPCIHPPPRLSFAIEDKATQKRDGAVRIVNMVAYMPVAGGKKLLHPSMSLTSQKGT